MEPAKRARSDHILIPPYLRVGQNKPYHQTSKTIHIV